MKANVLALAMSTAVLLAQPAWGVESGTELSLDAQELSNMQLSDEQLGDLRGAQIPFFDVFVDLNPGVFVRARGVEVCIRCIRISPCVTAC